MIIATAGAAVLSAVLLALCYAHRTGRLTLLRRVSARLEDGPARGMAGWAALPTIVATIALVTALLGMYWDISLHISNGRDPGPLANIAHYPILIGLFGLFAAGVLAVVLPLDERPGPAPVRIIRGWYAPVGGLLLAGAGLYALLGFPLDDIWHRVFGQDVTLWGPTHLMLIGGAGLSLVAVMILDSEGRASRPRAEPRARWHFVRRTAITGALLIGLSVFQGEFDFGVPQFRLVFQPLLIALAAGCALVAARLWAGRGGAVAAVLFYFLIRGGVSLLVGPVIGQLLPSVPLYLAEALCVEAAALVLATRPLLLGVASGVLIGTAGFAAEYAWSQFAMTIPWTTDILVEGPIMAVVGGVAGGLLGAVLALGVAGELPRPALARGLFAAALVAIAAAVTNGLIVTVPQHAQATVQLTDPGRPRSQARITLDPRDIADHPAWLDITAWQGHGLYVGKLVPLGNGVYRTTRPIPLYGDWKTLIRLHDGRTLTAVPIYLPDDPEIGAKKLPAPAHFTRPFQPERHILQRELKTNVPSWLWAAASAVVLVCTLTLVIGLGWGVARISRALSHRTAPARAETVRTEG